MDDSTSNYSESNNGGNQDYDFDYPSFESCVSPTAMESTILNNISVPSSLISVNNGNASPKKSVSGPSVSANISNGSSNGSSIGIETKVIKFPAKNVPKNSEKFFSDLKNKVLQLSSQIIVSKLPCGGYNILVKSPREKAIDAASLVERELQPKITKKIRLEPRRFTLLTAKNFEVAKETLQDVAKDVIVGSQQNNTLTLTGIASDVSRALQLITKFMDKATTSETVSFDEVPPKFYSHIRGAFNCNLTRIISECDNCVCIDIPPPSIHTNNTRPITITGPQEYQQKAKSEIIKVFNIVRKNAIVKTFKISSPLHANIRRACGLDKILKETNVAVILPTEGQPQDSVVFVGLSKDIPTAFHLSLSRARVYSYFEVPCKPWVLKIMKQKPHLSFSDLKINFQHTWISYLTSKECIALDGPSEEVETIKNIYSSEIENVTRNMSFTNVRVPASYIIHIQGIGSRITKKICDATNTKIDFSSDSHLAAATSIDNQVTVITIFGKKDDIEEAGELFDEYITQLNETSTLEITLDSLLLPYVVSMYCANSIHEEIKRNFGSALKINVKNMKNKRVSCISLQGRKGAVLGAQSLIDDMVKRATNEIAIHDVIVPAAYHHLLVGKKGVVRDEIIEYSGVDKIIFPNTYAHNSSGVDDMYQPPADVITLVGSLKACKLAEIIMTEKCNFKIELDQIDIQLPKSLIEKLRLGDGIILRRIISSCINNNNNIIVDDNVKSNAVNVHLPTGDLQPINPVRIHGYKSFTKAVSEKLLSFANKNSLFVECFNIDDELIKSVIGRGGSQLKKFSEASSVDIIIASDRPKKGKSSKGNAKSATLTNNIYLMGPSLVDITKIKNQIIKFVNDLKDITDMTVNVKKKYIKKFFIRKGETESLISQLSSKYPSVKITMPKEEEGSTESEDISKEIRLRGPSKMVDNAHAEITNFVKKWDATIRVEFSLPYDHVNLLRNVESPNFTSIGKEFDVNIRSFRDGDKATKPTSDTTVSVVIEGVNKNVSGAKEKIFACGPVTGHFSAPRQYHRALIGQKGIELKKVVDGLNVSITFPEADSTFDDIIVRGPKNQLQTAIDRLKTALDAAKKRQLEWEKSNHIVEMSIDSKWFSKLIGRGGKQIKALKHKLNVSITIPKNESSTKSDENCNRIESASAEVYVEDNGEAITASPIDVPPPTSGSSNHSRIILRGEKKLCEQAQKTIEAMVNEWENTVTSQFELPKSIHGKVRGVRSATINKIQKRFKVEVRFAPIEEEDNNTIKVSGLAQNVENAVKHIKELASQFISNEDDEGENYQIPNNIDPWGSFKFTAVESTSRSDSQQISSIPITSQRTSQRPSVSSEAPVVSDQKADLSSDEYMNKIICENNTNDSPGQSQMDSYNNESQCDDDSLKVDDPNAESPLVDGPEADSKLIDDDMMN